MSDNPMVVSHTEILEILINAQEKIHQTLELYKVLSLCPPVQNIIRPYEAMSNTLDAGLANILLAIETLHTQTIPIANNLTLQAMIEQASCDPSSCELAQGAMEALDQLEKEL